MLYLQYSSSVYVVHFPAYYNDICVGAIACRLEKRDDGAVRVYIMTLGVLAPYRGLGVGKYIFSSLPKQMYPLK